MNEKEELVKKALFSFVRKQVPTAQLRYKLPVSDYNTISEILVSFCNIF